MGMSADVFERACAVAARTFGRKANVSVIFQGDEAQTNGSMIVLPSLDRSKELTDSQVSITRGYVDHEAGHVLYTNQKDYDAGIKAAKKRNDALCATYINALEDVRMEAKVLETYPGSRANLAATSDAVNRSFLDDHLKDNPDLIKDMRVVGPLAVTWAGRQAMGHTIQSLEEGLSKLEPNHRAMVEAWADAASKCRSTKDIIALAERIAKETREEHQEPEPEPGEGDGSSEGEEEEGEEGYGERQSRRMGNPGRGRGEDEDRKIDFDGSDATRGTDPDQEEPEPFDVTIKMENVLGVDKSGKSYRPWTTKYDRVQTRNSPTCSATLDYGDVLSDPRGNKRFKDAVDRMGTHIGTMSRKLSNALLDKERRDWGSGYEQGRLDNKRLVMAFNGAPNVFKLREDTSAVNTAVTLLVDCSGSMEGHKLSMARIATVALVQAIDGTGCALEVLGFNTVHSVPRQWNEEFQKACTAGGQFSRFYPHHLWVFKDFQDDLRRSRVSIGNICDRVACNAANVDGESLLLAYARLRQRPEAKKIIVVLSDGHPACSSHFGSKHLFQHLRDAVAYVSGQGVKLIGIGIEDTSVKQFYPNWTVINDPSELSGRAIDMVAAALLGKAITPGADLMKASANAKRLGR